MSPARAAGLGLAVRALVRRRRLLPVRGRVLVSEGQEVAPGTLLAEASRPGPLHVLDVAAALDLAPAAAAAALLVRVGERVEAGQVVGRARGWLGRGGRECRVPVPGTLVAVSPVTGRALVEGSPEPVRLLAWLPGRVDEVLPELGAVLSVEATVLHGVFGLGPECAGPLRMAVGDPAGVLDEAGIAAAAAGCVLVAGAGITAAGLAAAARLGVAALITGGIEAEDLLALPGGESALAGGGEPGAGPAIVVTEGFGRVPMLAERFELLAQREGSLACVAAATEIRAGAVRPEVVLPWPDRLGARTEPTPAGPAPGSRVRVVAPPWLGRDGRVRSLPPGRLALPSGTEAEVALVALEPDGLEVAVALANLECT